MTLLHGQVLLSAPWPEGNDGLYYWLHTFYVQSTDFANNSQMNLACLGDMKLLYTEQVQIWSIRWKVAGTNTVFFEVIYGTPQFGDQPAQDNFTLLIAARWRLHASDGSYSYHLHRQPMGEDYFTSGEYSPLGLTQQHTRLNTFMAQGIYRSQTGSLLTVGELASRPIMWQLRHGTKRRRRRFWLP